MKFLVIGGAGYIGSCFVEKVLNTTRHEVIILDDLSTGYTEAIDDRAIFFNGSVLDYEMLDKIFKDHKIDCVFHFAAKLIVSESVEKPIKYWTNNVGGMAILLEAMKNNEVKNIVFSSTAAVYGNPSTVPVNETYPTNPCNPYGSSKLACETIIKEAHSAYGINYSILRYFNVAGASDSNRCGLRNLDPTLLIPVINKSVILNQQMNIYGDNYPTKDGTCIRDYIHIEDLIDAHILAFDYLNRTNDSQIFNLGTSEGYSVLEVVNTVPKAILKSVNYKIADRRPGDPTALLTNNSKANQLLNWYPKRDLESMIKSDYEFRKKLYK